MSSEKDYIVFNALRFVLDVKVDTRVHGSPRHVVMSWLRSHRSWSSSKEVNMVDSSVDRHLIKKNWYCIQFGNRGALSAFKKSFATCLLEDSEGRGRAQDSLLCHPDSLTAMSAVDSSAHEWCSISSSNAKDYLEECKPPHHRKAKTVTPAPQFPSSMSADELIAFFKAHVPGLTASATIKTDTEGSDQGSPISESTKEPVPKKKSLQESDNVLTEFFGPAVTDPNQRSKKHAMSTAPEDAPEKKIANTSFENSQFSFETPIEKSPGNENDDGTLVESGEKPSKLLTEFFGPIEKEPSQSSASSTAHAGAPEKKVAANLSSSANSTPIQHSAHAAPASTTPPVVGYKLQDQIAFLSLEHQDRCRFSGKIDSNQLGACACAALKCIGNPKFTLIYETYEAASAPDPSA